MAIKDTNLTIMIKDMNRSVSFYQSIGFETKNRWGDHYAQLEAPGITIGLHPSPDNFTGSGNVSVGFTTEDLVATRKLLLDQSITVTERNEEGGQFLHFSDPDGTQLYFIKPKW